MKNVTLLRNQVQLTKKSVQKNFFFDRHINDFTTLPFFNHFCQESKKTTSVQKATPQFIHRQIKEALLSHFKDKAEIEAFLKNIELTTQGKKLFASIEQRKFHSSYKLYDKAFLLIMSSALSEHNIPDIYDVAIKLYSNLTLSSAYNHLPFSKRAKLFVTLFNYLLFSNFNSFSSLNSYFLFSEENKPYFFEVLKSFLLNNKSNKIKNLKFILYSITEEVFKHFSFQDFFKQKDIDLQMFFSSFFHSIIFIPIRSSDCLFILSKFREEYPLFSFEQKKMLFEIFSQFICNSSYNNYDFLSLSFFYCIFKQDFSMQSEFGKKHFLGDNHYISPLFYSLIFLNDNYFLHLTREEKKKLFLDATLTKENIQRILPYVLLAHEDFNSLYSNATNSIFKENSKAFSKKVPAYYDKSSIPFKTTQRIASAKLFYLPNTWIEDQLKICQKYSLSFLKHTGSKLKVLYYTLQIIDTFEQPEKKEDVAKVISFFETFGKMIQDTTVSLNEIKENFDGFFRKIAIVFPDFDNIKAKEYKEEILHKLSLLNKQYNLDIISDDISQSDIEELAFNKTKFIRETVAKIYSKEPVLKTKFVFY